MPTDATPLFVVGGLAAAAAVGGVIWIVTRVGTRSSGFGWLLGARAGANLAFVGPQIKICCSCCRRAESS